MKNKIIYILCIINVVFLCACNAGDTDMFSRFYDSDQEIADETINNLISALQNEDTDKIKKMFSESIVSDSEEFDDILVQLFQYYQGDFISYNDWGGPGSSSSIDYFDKKYEIYSTYDVKTSETTYRIAIYEITEDTVTPENIGIYSLYIIKMEDDIDPQYAYWGDDKWTEGINIGVQNTPPEFVE